MRQGSNRGRRKSEDIITGMLVSAMQGASKTKIMYDNELNFSQLKRYLNHTIKNGLLEVKVSRNGAKAKKVYFTTSKGIEYINVYSKILDINSNEIIEGNVVINSNNIGRGELHDRDQ